MIKILDACVAIRLMQIGAFDSVLDAYGDKLYVTESVHREVSKEPARSTLQQAIDNGRIKVHKSEKKELELAYRELHKKNIKIHFDDVPNVVAAKDMNAELVTDDFVLFTAAEMWRKDTDVNLFVLNTRGLLFEMFLSKKMDLISFIKWILDIYKLSEIPNISHQLQRRILSVDDIQKQFGEYQRYLVKAIQIAEGYK
ncbi:hypothetical protein ACFLQI_03320 [Candidatus Undinarchaeota archaeon]